MHVAAIKHSGNYIVVIIIVVIVIIFITYMKDIYNYIPETNHLSKAPSFATIDYIRGTGLFNLC